MLDNAGNVKDLPVTGSTMSTFSEKEQNIMTGNRQYSSRIFIVMLQLYGTREDTKIWAKIISAHAKRSRRVEVSVAEGRWVGQKGTLNRPLGA